MSDQVLKLIPEDKDYLPSREAAESARVLLEEFFPDGEQAEAEFSESLKFIDGGASLERIRCPLCDKTTEINPFQENDVGTAWWYELDKTLSASPDLNALQVAMPCCKQSASIQYVDFSGAAGFSKFELCIWNPYAEKGISEEQVSKLEHLLGCKLKQIWAHY